MSNGGGMSDWRAWLLAYDYNLIPVEPLKYEETIPTDDIGSHFFANTSNTIKILIQYDTTELPEP